MQMTKDNQVVTFAYDAAGTPLTMKVGENTYYYVTNLQGDITGLVNANGTTVASYSYTAYGVVTATGDATVIALNPLTYRGYVYDAETGLYYLQSRYYDPVIGRFINADAFVATGQGFTGNNMFAYCLNNPVNRCDHSGNCSHNGNSINLCFWCRILVIVYTIINSTSEPNSDYGAAVDYRYSEQTGGSNYSYLWGGYDTIMPGDISGECPDNYNNIDDVKKAVIADGQALGYHVRELSGPNDKLYPNERVVIIRVSDENVVNKWGYDYPIEPGYNAYFLIKTQNGWAGRTHLGHTFVNNTAIDDALWTVKYWFLDENNEIQYLLCEYGGEYAYLAIGGPHT